MWLAWLNQPRTGCLKRCGGINVQILENVSIGQFTTLGIGGVAEKVFQPESISEVQGLLGSTRESTKKLYVLGAGSNLLVQKDLSHFDFIRLADNLVVISLRGRRLLAQGGVRLSKIRKICRNQELAGLEWTTGIPATVGGAVAMNAGAFGRTVADNLKRVKVVDWQGQLREFSCSELEFDYRQSQFPRGGIIVETEFSLEESSANTIERRQKEFLQRRKNTQPLNEKTAGSVFKNPGNESAGKLIDEAGLKGERRGEAKISEKHANFIINCGDARCADVLRLIERVRHRILKLYGLELELEIEVVGERKITKV